MPSMHVLPSITLMLGMEVKFKTIDASAAEEAEEAEEASGDTKLLAQ